MCRVRLRHKDAKCRFFVEPGDGPVFLGMPDTELLNIMKITCEVIGDPHGSSKFDSQAEEASSVPSCKTKHHLLRQIKQMQMIQM